MFHRSRRLGSFFILTLAIAAIPSLVLAAQGRTVGLADVSDSGQATYSIPLFTPSGTNGLQPSLSLNYNSGADEGLFGVGWSLSGLSGISRCNSTWAQDSIAREVRNDASDKFCLDGQKLRLVSGTYGQSGSTYSTEGEQFARITANGVAGNGPAYFVVEYANGLVFEYGNTPDSRIESLGQSTVRFWAVNKIRDRSGTSGATGNAINFQYFEDSTNGGFRITSITYAENVAQGVTAPYTISFSYLDVPAGDIDTKYAGGSLIKRVVRATQIDVTHSSGTLVRRYKLGYESSLSSTSKSRLASVTECAGSPEQCFSPTTFSYQNGTNGYSSEVLSGASVPAGTRPLPMDVNGDGREDLVYSSTSTSGTGTWRVMFGNSSGSFDAPINTGITNTNFSGAITIDYDGDGREDLLVPYSGGTWWVMLGSSSGLSSPTNTGAPATGTGPNARAIDINGDGLEDLVWADINPTPYAGGDVIRYRLRVWGGAFSSTATDLFTAYGAGWAMASGVFGPAGRQSMRRSPDFNGDGRGDVLFQVTRRTGTVGHYTFTSYLVAYCSGSWNYSVTIGNGSGIFPQYPDLNGDGRSDLLWAGGTQLRYAFSTGTGFTTTYFGPDLTNYNSANTSILDWDGDGRDDLIVGSNVSKTQHVFRSTGEAYAAPFDTGISADPAVIYSEMGPMDIDGDGLADITYSKSGTQASRVHVGVAPDLLLSATDGYSVNNTFSYSVLPSYSNYTKGTGATYPTKDIVPRGSVVSNLQSSDGIGGTFNFDTYIYQTARVDMQGRGSLGFGYRSFRDSRDQTVRSRSIRQDYPYAGRIIDTRRVQSSGTTIDETQIAYGKYDYGSGTETRQFVYPTTTTYTEHGVGASYNGSPLRVATTTNLYDSATGALYDQKVESVEPASGANGLNPGRKWTVRAYVPTPATDIVNDTTNWCRGRFQHLNTQRFHELTYGGLIERKSGSTWDTTHCRVSQTVAEPLDPSLQVTTDITYDYFGNASGVTTTGVNMSSRGSSLGYAGTVAGQFPTSVTNALSEQTLMEWDYALGAPKSVADPNGIKTIWDYDAFGRTIKETHTETTTMPETARPKTSTTWSYSDCSSFSGGCIGSNNKSVLVETDLDKNDGYINDRQTYLDRFDRPIIFSTRTLSGAYDRIDRQYDSLGRVTAETIPCLWASCTTNWKSFSYDMRDRLTQVSRRASDADSGTQTSQVMYEGLTTRYRDALSTDTLVVSDASGEIVRTTDAAGYSINFDFDAFGGVKRVSDGSNVLRTASYNLRGMLTDFTDMDRGSWTILPNALGEVDKIRDAKTSAPNWTFTLTHDLLGRLTNNQVAEGSFQWTWGNSPSLKNVGRLVSASAPGYQESYAYDSMGRRSTQNFSADTSYQVLYSYNDSGLLDTLTYPAGPSGYSLKVIYGYQNGYPVSITDANTSAMYWQVNASNARSQITRQTLSNTLQLAHSYDSITGLPLTIQAGYGGGTAVQNLEYAWDRVGNLKSRKDWNQSGLTEAFTYDNLYRLDYSQLNGITNQDLSYDSLGNITYNSLVPPAPDPATAIGTYSYDPLKKHQVTGTSNGWSFVYDPNGNMTSDRGNTITWTSFGYPSSITHGSLSSSFSYTFDYKKYFQNANYSGGGATTVYIGDLLEKVTSGSITDYRYQIRAGGSRVVISRTTAGASNSYYLTDDELGSSSTITGASGSTPTQLSYGAFGFRRASNWQNPPSTPSTGEWTSIANASRTGFTQQTMLDNLGLIHMEGRVLDPLLGRFTGADPFVTDPLNTQNYNRYSYVYNNPMSYTDPSGFSRDDVDPEPPYWSPDPFPHSSPWWVPSTPRPHSPPSVDPCAPHCTGPTAVPTIATLAPCPFDLMPCGSGFGGGAGYFMRPEDSNVGWSAIGLNEGSSGAETRDVQDWICNVGVLGCEHAIGGSPLFRVTWGGPFDGVAPPGRIPGGPWTWHPNQRNTRGGAFRDPEGRSANWDPSGHWDVDDGKGGLRQRYDRWGNPTENHRPPRLNAPKARPIARLASRALKALGAVGFAIWLEQVIEDPDSLRREIRENSLCTTGNCEGVDINTEQPKPAEKK